MDTPTSQGPAYSMLNQTPGLNLFAGPSAGFGIIMKLLGRDSHARVGGTGFIDQASAAVQAAGAAGQGRPLGDGRKAPSANQSTAVAATELVGQAVGLPPNVQAQLNTAAATAVQAAKPYVPDFIEDKLSGLIRALSDIDKD